MKNLFLPQVFAAEDDIASGTSGGVTWVIDSEGTLTLSPTNGVSGMMDSMSDSYHIPWADYREQIKKAVAKPGVALNYSATCLFYGCGKLKEIDFKNLNVSRVVDMSSMFSGCSALTSLEGLEECDTRNVTDMAGMFRYCKNLFSIKSLSKWNTDNVTTMNSMFFGCSALASLEPLKGWNTSNVANMSYMFENCNDLTSLEGLEGWDTSNVTSMYEMFRGCANLAFLTPIAKWNTNNVTNMGGMFASCGKLTTLKPLTEWNTENVTSMEMMFIRCSALTSLEGLEKWKTGSVKNMDSMFFMCTSLTSLEPLAEWDTSNVTTMYQMFLDCNSLTSLSPLGGWNTENVTNMESMFWGCSKAESADFSNWKPASNRHRMLNECYLISEITISAEFDFTDTSLPQRYSSNKYTGAWAYGDPWNHAETISGYYFRTGTHKAGTWYWERKGENPASQHYTSMTSNIFTPEYLTNPDGSTSLKQLPTEAFPNDGFWQKQDDNSWVYTFYVFDASVKWYVWEEPVPDGYTSSATRDNPIIIENGSIVSTITNTLETMPKAYGNLSIQKQLVDSTQALSVEEQSFPFRITLSDEANQQLSGVDMFGGITFNNGVAYQSVSPSVPLEISGIPAGYRYTVEELPDDKYIQEITNHTGIIQPDNEETTAYADNSTGLVVATNTRIPEPERTYGNLILRKTVTGNTDTNEAFDFVVSLDNLEPDTAYTYGDKTFNSDSEGSADVEVSLKNNEVVPFNNLPTDSQYRIMEEAGNYTSSYTITDANNQGMINQTIDSNEAENEELVTAMETLDEDEDITVEFINKINKTQKVSIAKVVENSNGEVITDDSRYEFSVEFTDAEADTKITSNLGVLRTDEEGNASASFFLKNGETLEFDGVPVGAKYRFTEVENNAIASYAITDTLENDSVIKQNDANTTVKQALSTEFETVDNNEDSTVTFTNTYIKGALTVIKRSSDGDLLMGAEFRLTGSDGTVYEPENVATDANGRIAWTELPFGTYTLTETKAPAGTTLTKEPIQIEITENAPDVSIEITDNSAIFLDAGGTGLITWMTISSAILALVTALLLTNKKKRYNL